MTLAEPPLLGEARRLLAAAEHASVPLRLLGGMGIRVLLGERIDPRFERAIEDIDFITTRRAARDVERLLADEGWEPERRFNTLNGARRLLFGEAQGEAKIDVFVQTFQMCHELPLAERIEVRPQTLPAAELAMSKLQIVSLNAKDRDDLYALLAGLQVGDLDFDPADGQDEINAARIATLAAADWGLHHTFELNIQRLRAGIAEAQLPERLVVSVRARLDALARALSDEPKTRAWKLRARIGERRRWYEQPEEVAR